MFEIKWTLAIIFVVATLNQEEVLSLPGTTFNVKVRSDLPTLPEECPGVYLYYCEREIRSLGGASKALLAKHSGITASLVPGGAPKCDSLSISENGMTLDFAAVNFPLGAVFPTVSENVPPKWSNEAIVRFSTDMVSGDENKMWDSKIKVGKASSKTFNLLMDFVVTYLQGHPGYQLFDVWSSPLQPEHVWYSGTICDSFSNSFLLAAWEYGGVDFSISKDTLMYRNHIPMISSKAPTGVDLTDQTQLHDLNHFYETFSQVQGSNLNSIVAALIKRQGNTNFYVYNAVDKTYKKFELVSPYVGLVGLYQPMRFPWQKNLIQSCPSANAVSTMPTWLAIVLCAISTIIGGAVSAAYFSKKRAADNSYIPM